MKYEFIILIAYVAVLVLASLVALILYGKDKKMAEHNGNEVRIKEKTLLSIAAFGGALGALIGRIIFHHKTNKGYFSFIILFSLILQAGVLVFLLATALGWIKF